MRTATLHSTDIRFRNGLGHGLGHGLGTAFVWDYRTRTFANVSPLRTGTGSYAMVATSKRFFSTMNRLDWLLPVEVSYF